jgi:hypothetical protein
LPAEFEGILVLMEDLSKEVLEECKAAFEAGRPWTKIRVIETGDPQGGSCVGSLGKFEVDCDQKVEAIQYTSVPGGIFRYCEKHALEQSNWDKILYDSKPIPRPPMTTAEEAWLKRFMEKGKKKKPKEELEEIEPS